MKIHIPPLKCQGIKSKLVPWIKSCVEWDGKGLWIEPFLGSGVVGFNIQPKAALFCDNNPHIINFYNEIKTGAITAELVRKFLEAEGHQLTRQGQDYYYEVRERFNRDKAPLDFLFLNRACFNGVIRFNRRGEFNVPFGHKPERFAKAYITKIVNQVAYVAKLTKVSDWTFLCQDYQRTLADVSQSDFVYCDPPYLGRHVDYFNSWEENDEEQLCELLKICSSKFILSTWQSTSHRENVYLQSLWSKFQILTKEHFYHVGAKEHNRNSVQEALVLNFRGSIQETALEKPKQLVLLEPSGKKSLN
jgi:DNA adenine methylase